MFEMQMMAQMIGAAASGWELPAVNARPNSDKDTDTSFQSLLQQRQEKESQNVSEGKPAQEAPAQDAPAADVPAKEDRTADSTTLTMDLAALSAAALLAGGLQQLQPQADPAVQPQVQTAVEAVAAQVAPTGEEGAAAQVPVPVQEQANLVQAEQLPEMKQTATTAEGLVQPQAQEAEGAVQQVPTAAAQDDASAALQQQGGQTARQEDAPQVTDASGVWESPLFGQTEQIPVKVAESVPVDTTVPAAELEQSLEKALSSGLEKGGQYLEIQLSPADLGTVTAEFIRSPEGVLHVVLRAETPEAAKLLSDHAGALGLLLQHGSQSEVHVQVPQPGQDQQLWQQPDQEGGQQHQQQQQRQAPRQEGESFLQQLRLGLVEIAPEEIG